MAPIPKPKTKTPLEVALDYAAQGWPVFPCRHVDEEVIDTNTGEIEVRAKAKAPLTHNGFKSATADRQAVTAFWSRFPNAMIGIPTGEPIGAFVVDIDVKAEVNGFEWLREMEAKHGRLPDTLTANTASGGQHIYFRYVEGVRNRGALGPGVDLRGQGGYVVAPGSVMKDGRRYTWTNDEEIAEAPAWLLDLVVRKPSDNATPTTYTPYTGSNSAYVDAAVEEELSELAATPQGHRNNALNDAAFALGQFVGAGALSRADAEASLHAIYSQWSNIRLSQSTAKRGLDAGQQQPRGIPDAYQFDDGLEPYMPHKLLAKLGTKADVQPDAEDTHASESYAESVSRGSDKPAILAANDNRKEPTLPPMHPAPFTPEAAGGLLGNVARWVTETAIIPVPELSLSAAIALLAGLFGKKALTPTEAGVNVYLTTLMATAGGKGHPPKAIRRLAGQLGEAGAAAVVNGDHTSYAAIERTLRRSPSTAIVMDEFGLTLQDVNAKHRNSVAASIRKFLLAVYDQANSQFDGRIYASAEAKKESEPIDGPALTVLGMTTMTTLYEGLTDASVSDGFLNRFLFVSAADADRTIRPPKLKRESGIPTDLVKDLEEAITKFPVPKTQGFGKTDRKWVVPMDGGDTGKAYALWAQIFLWQHDKYWTGDVRDIIARAAENTIRLATLRAISANPKFPEVTYDDVAWAWGVVYRSIEIIKEGVSKHMSSSPAEALRKAILDALEGAGEAGLAYSKLMSRKGVKGSDTRQLEEAIKWLLQSGQMTVDLNGKPKPGPGCKFYLGTSVE